MRLGATLRHETDDPEEIARRVVAAGYGAATYGLLSQDILEAYPTGGRAAQVTWPSKIPHDIVRATREAYARHDVLLAEVGAWSNMLHPDPARRASNVLFNAEGLALADELGALCCVNIVGSFSPTSWLGPDARNFTAEAFELTVHNVRQIIDSAKPSRARYCLEMHQFAIPDTADLYLELIRAIDRPAFGVHVDPVNLINCPRLYYQTASVVRDVFARLGPWIVSCHAKDLVLSDKLSVDMRETRPGLGGMDYRAYIGELGRMPSDVPLIIEHLATPEDYAAARDYIIGVASELGLSFNTPQPRG